jgi:hypothetical protein
MSEPDTSFSHVVLWMGSEAWPLQSQIVAADALRRDGERLTLLRDGRVVFQVRSSDVAHVETHPSRHAAKHAFDERRATRGRGHLRVQELAPATSAASSGGAPGSSAALTRGGPAEGIGFRVSEDR